MKWLTQFLNKLKQTVQSNQPRTILIENIKDFSRLKAMNEIINDYYKQRIIYYIYNIYLNLNL